jgi:O-antigen ligase
MNALLIFFNICLLALVTIGFSSFLSSVFVNTKLLLFIFGFLVLIVGLIYKFIFNTTVQFNKFENKTIYISLILTSLLLIYSLFISINPIMSVFGTFERGLGVFVFFVLIFLFVLNICFLKKSDLLYLIRGILLVNMVLCFYGILQYMGIDPFFKYYDTGLFHGRIFSFLGNPSFLAQFIAICLPLNLVTFKQYRKFSVFSCLLSICALALTLTRSSILAVICGVFLLIFKTFPKYFIRFCIAAVLLLSILALFVPRFNPSNAEALNSLNSRLVTWNATLNLIQQNPWGSGVASFASVFPSVLKPEIALYEDGTHVIIDNPHNQVLGVLSSVGWVGLFFYLSFVTFVLYRFFYSNNFLSTSLSLALIINLLQNQLNFFDLASLLLCVCLFSYLIIDTFKYSENMIESKFLSILSSVLCLFFCGLVFLKILFANIYYSEFVHFYKYDKDFALNSLRLAANNAAFYDHFLMDLYEHDTQSIETQLEFWNYYDKASPRGEFYKSQLYKQLDITKSRIILEQLVLKNSNNYMWVRSFADVLYKTGEYDLSKKYYLDFLEMFPDLVSDSSEKLKYFYSKSPEFGYVRNRISEL